MVNVPGLNLLGMALQLIANQSVVYYRWESRALNAARKYVNTYAEPVTIERCSVQAVPLTRYDLMGLDRKKIYVTLFAPADILAVQRNRGTDYFIWNGQTYTVDAETPWKVQDGWVEVLGIQAEQQPV